jgi:nucleoside-diphosphate-sugar epimerase
VKVAVTGATGYVGQHVVAELERRGIEPTIVTRSATAARGRTVVLDMKTDGHDAFERMDRPDVLIHLAWDGLPNYKSSFHVDTELPAQIRFLELLVRDGLATLLVAGTCLEYGMQSGALSEDMPTDPVTQYGLAKDRLRQRLQRLQSEISFRLTWARLFYSYGEGQSPNSLLPQLRQAVARGDTAFRMSAGDQLRDYLPAAEQARLLVTLALNGRDNGVVNVCAGEAISVKQLVERFIAENEWSISLELGHYPYPDYEPMAFWGDRRKLDRCLSP